MPHDQAKVEETAAWLNKAKDDLRAANIDLAADPPLVEDALFHCQQAVEKTVKSFLTWHDQPFRKTHNLVELGMQCVDVDPSIEPVLQEAAKLSEYATKYRYPGETTAVVEEASAGLELAQNVVEQVLARLPSEARP